MGDGDELRLARRRRRAQLRSREARRAHNVKIAHQIDCGRR